MSAPPAIAGPAVSPTAATEVISTGARSSPLRWRALAVLSIMQTVIVMDTTIVYVALPSIARDLGFSAGGLAWVIDAYLLAGGGLLLCGGRLADLLGRRRILVLGSVVFGLASLLSGLAPAPWVLVTARFAQGVGEALTLPAALSMIAVLFPVPAERGRAMGIWGGVTGVAATCGGVLSGVITDLLTWRALFLVNVPVVLVALALTGLWVPRGEDPSRRAVDLPGAILVTGGLVAVVDGLLRTAYEPATDPAVTVPVLGGFLALVAFVVLQSQRREPLVPLRVFLDRTRVAANLASIGVMGVMGVMFLIVTLQLAQVLGFSPLATGLALLPSGLAFVLGVTLAVRFGSRIGRTRALTGFVLLAAVGMAAMAFPPGDGYLAGVLPGLLVASVGIGACHPLLQTAALHGVDDDDAGLASGIQVSVQSLSKAVGIALVVPIAERVVAGAREAGAPPATAITLGHHVAFGVAVCGLVAAAIVVVLGARRST